MAKPDDVIFVEIHTATGKISKLELRKLVANLDYKHPDLDSLAGYSKLEVMHEWNSKSNQSEEVLVAFGSIF